MLRFAWGVVCRYAFAENHYAVLGVAPQAGAETLARAYRAQQTELKQAFGRLPWVLGLCQGAADAAYAVLADPDRRLAYDQELRRRSESLVPPPGAI